VRLPQKNNRCTQQNQPSYVFGRSYIHYLILGYSMKQIKRKNRFYKSRLDIYTGEILTLYRHGEAISQIQVWLKNRGETVAWSTVSRFIKNNTGGE
jgi:hypothetical protein